ncbi:helix-turn-helix domain-containing protein [Paenibacillus apiarius]|uniref:helix-turn-helix domain-containing protein n=1 Tax=Paenibacillus apiarius TaxID=46240 RepID=UPI003B3A6E24
MNREYLYVKWGLKEGDDMGSELRRVGELIHDYRKRARYTLHQLSALSGIPKGTISKIERGETKHPELDTVLALSSPLLISYEDVVNHYVVMEKRKNILHHMLLEAVRVSDMNIIEKVAARFLECDGVDRKNRILKMKLLYLLYYP